MEVVASLAGYVVGVTPACDVIPFVTTKDRVDTGAARYVVDAVIPHDGVVIGAAIDRIAIDGEDAFLFEAAPQDSQRETLTGSHLHPSKMVNSG